MKKVKFYLAYISMIGIFMAFAYWYFFKADISESKLGEATNYAENNKGEIAGYAMLTIIWLCAFFVASTIFFKNDVKNIKLNPWQKFCTFSGIYLIIQTLVKLINFSLNKFGYDQMGALGYAILSIVTLIGLFIYAAVRIPHTPHEDIE